MKKIISFVAFAFMLFNLTSCAEKIVVNRVVDSEKYGKILLGPQTRSQFSKEPFNSWYDYGYKEYEFDKTLIDQLKKNKITSYHITVVLGTWCSDSQREVPRLMKILDAVKFPEGKLHIIGLTRKKEGINGEEVQYGIKKVPTIIVEKYGQEIGRITETPQTGSLERDLLDIIKKKR